VIITCLEDISRYILHENRALGCVSERRGNARTSRFTSWHRLFSLSGRILQVRNFGEA